MTSGTFSSPHFLDSDTWEMGQTTPSISFGTNCTMVTV